ncbi:MULTISPECIES: diguanylate cyclase [Pantoea]|mgnify:CR=1 FL=1|jgi:RraA family protein|uniref:Putative 4-hydroxy-4-methyl-2-oxoglutarate aldolase n=1 Tax=Pantoea dispersa TaxID=59814 RepID=A0A8E1S372_9GAMM|nr:MULTISPECIES: diguanylate cyclase [Pantoea]ERH62239.1 diguanylate cyclase [Pantoea dispersa EGD-AAK13]KAA6100332.1 RraA family protein [Pantoea sp. B_9]KAA6110807.1 RraA family protein [Pantoea sp. B_10]KTR91025.1 diguanylate cyclase [Pantoea dispersa]KTR98749.1 diguanylate cyclase [Pantoea dispersa]
MSVSANNLINRNIERVSALSVSQAAAFQAAILADVAGRRGTLHGRVKPLSPQMKVAGPAITVEVRPGDNLAIHAALAIAQPGDVLVVDGKGDISCALLGEIMATQAEASGIAGIIIDGAVRDADALAQGSYPVFAAGLNPSGPTKSIPGRVNHPVSVAGASIEPGDLVVGDADGVVVIAKQDVERIIALAAKKLDAETRRIAGIKQGDLRPGWLEGALRAAGMLAEGESL